MALCSSRISVLWGEIFSNRFRYFFHEQRLRHYGTTGCNSAVRHRIDHASCGHHDVDRCDRPDGAVSGRSCGSLFPVALGPHRNHCCDRLCGHRRLHQSIAQHWPWHCRGSPCCAQSWSWQTGRGTAFCHQFFGGGNVHLNRAQCPDCAVHRRTAGIAWRQRRRTGRLAGFIC